jgi:hypothetical protein
LAEANAKVKTGYIQPWDSELPRSNVCVM